MDLHQLRIFLSVFKHRSFTLASEELRLAQPTVSDHIKTLEEEFGFRLFDRLGRSIIPTEEAEAFFGPAQELVEKADMLKRSIQPAGKEVSGDITVGASTIPGTYILPAVMASLSKEYPSAGPEYSKKVDTAKLKPAELLNLIEHKWQNYVLVDVRDETEFREGHIPTAINIPVETFAARSEALPKDRTIIVYCNTGGRSYAAYRKLIKLAYPDIRQTLFADWKDEGLKIEN